VSTSEIVGVKRQGRARGTRWDWLALALLAIAGCAESFPRDPEGTTERVRRTGELRVGLTENPPWVRHAEGQEAIGVEVELVRRLAASLSARPVFRAGQQDALLSALARFELDLVVGGIGEDTPWQERVGLSEPWLERPEADGGNLVLAVPPGENGWLGIVQRFVWREQPALRALAREASP